MKQNKNIVRVPELKGCKFVDLGLPSGNLWAECNLGAEKPEEAGLYFAWGDVKGHTATEGYDFSEEQYAQTEASEITTDIPATEDYDAARAMLGGSARIPSRGDFIELQELCTWRWTERGGMKGYLVTGTNDNSIFLPAAGISRKKILYVGTYGNYWESAMYYMELGCKLFFNEDGVYPHDSNYRCCGYSVRAVQ